MSYQEPKSREYGVNLCESCLEKQREIDRLKEENLRLRQKLNLNERKIKQGFFGSSTSSAKVPVKAGSLLEKQAKQGGGDNTDTRELDEKHLVLPKQTSNGLPKLKSKIAILVIVLCLNKAQMNEEFISWNRSESRKFTTELSARNVLFVRK